MAYLQVSLIAYALSLSDVLFLTQNQDCMLSKTICVAYSVGIAIWQVEKTVVTDLLNKAYASYLTFLGSKHVLQSLHILKY